MVAVLAAQAAVFLEPFHRLGVEHFRPQVGVITGRVAAHDVREVGAAVTRRHRRVVQARGLERLGFEGQGVGGDVAGGLLVDGLVEHGRGQVLGGRVALAVLFGGQHLVQQFLRDRFAGFMVLGVVGQDRRPGRPHLVDLRRVFDEVARHRGAGELRVLHVREQAVQGMAELMEHGGDFVEAHQGRLAVGRLGDVLVVGDHRLGAGQAVLRHVGIHPGTAALARAGVEVTVEQAQLAAVGLEDLPHAHVRVVDRDVLALLEAQAVELAGRVEHALLEHVVDLEVGLELGFVEGVLLLAHLVGVEGPVGGLELEVAAFGVDDRLHFGRFLAGVGDGGRGQVGHQLVHRLDGAGGFVLEHVLGVVVVAQQLGAVGAQAGDAGDDAGVVPLVAAGAAHQRGRHDLLAQLAVGEVGQRRLAGGVLQRDEVLALVAGFLGRRRGGGDRLLGQAVEQGHVVHQHGRIVHFLEHVLAEGGGQAGQLGVHRLQGFLVGVGQVGAGTDEVGVVTLEQALGLGVQAQGISLVVERLDAREELAVEQDRVLVGGELRRQGGLHLLDFGVGVGAGQVAEHRAGAVEQGAGFFHRDDGVHEARRVRVVGDRGDFGALLGHAALERRLVVLVLDQVEARRLVGQVADHEEGIARHRLNGGIGGLFGLGQHEARGGGGQGGRECEGKLVVHR